MNCATSFAFSTVRIKGVEMLCDFSEFCAVLRRVYSVLFVLIMLMNFSMI